MRRQLAHQHGAGIIEALHRGGVLRGNIVARDLGMPRGKDSSGIENILQAERNAVERPAILATGDFFFGGARLFAREFGGLGDEGVDLRIECNDARKQCINIFHR